MLAALCLVVVCFSATLLLTFPFGRDQGIFAVIGEGILNGQVPYRDLWDVKTPGIFFVFAAAEGIFGHHMVGPRILEVVGLLLTVGVLVDLGRRFFGDLCIGYLAAAIWTTIHQQLDFWHTCQPETFGGMIFLWVTWMVAYWKPRSALLKGTTIGLWLGILVLLKPHLGLGIPWILVGFGAWPTRATLRLRVKQAAAVALGATVVVSGFAAWMAHEGALGAAAWTWWKFAPGYSAVGADVSYPAFQASYYDAVVALVMQMSGLAGIGIVLYLSLSPRVAPNYRRFWWLLGFLAVLALVVVLQHKGFKYHYSAAFPVLALAAAAGWGQIWRLATRRSWRYSPLFFCVFGAAYFCRFPVSDLQGTTHERIALRLKQALFPTAPLNQAESSLALNSVRRDFDLDNLRSVSRWIKSEVSPQESILLWGCDSMIYWLSERRPATRFIHDIAQRSPWQMTVARSQFMGDITENSPAVVVVQHGDTIAPVTGEREDSAATIGSFPEFARYLKYGFRRSTTIGRFDIYKRSN